MIRFLLDENLSPRLQAGLQRRYPGIDVLRVGNPNAPMGGTSDPDILLYLEEQQRLLLTSNRASMPVHIAHHLADGHHHWGIVFIRRNVSYAILIDEVGIIWGASTPDEWRNRVVWIP